VRRRILDYATWQFPPLLAARAALEPGYLLPSAPAILPATPPTPSDAAGASSAAGGAGGAERESAFYPWGGALSKAAPRMR
jgi:hypothetical protein